MSQEKSPVDTLIVIGIIEIGTLIVLTISIMRNNLKVAALLVLLTATLSSCYYGHYGAGRGYGSRGGYNQHRGDRHGGYNHGGVRHHNGSYGHGGRR